MTRHWLLAALILLGCSNGDGGLADLRADAPDTTVFPLDLPRTTDMTDSFSDGSELVPDAATEVADLVLWDVGSEVDSGPDVILPETLPPYEPNGFIGTDGRHFRDETGRIMLFHGVNVADGSKSAPFFPEWLEEADFDVLASRGINVLRFLVVWEAIEPAEGEFDEAYLDMIEERVAWATSRGIYVLIDMHQDGWGSKFGGDGAPLWATLDHGKEFDPPLGDVLLGYDEPAVKQAFQSFWENEEGLRDHFVMAWQEVAQRFAGNPMVVGYDLINEPCIGQWDVADTPQFEAEVLTPFYAVVAAGIREIDAEHTIFVEPTARKGLGLVGGVGPIGEDNVSYAAHYYAPSMDTLGTYLDTKENMAELFEQIRDEALAIGGPPFLGEFGFYAGFSGDTEYARHQLEVMEELGFSFTIWSFDTCGNGLCLLDNQKQPLWPLEYITQTYPQRIAGRLLSWHYDRPARTLHLEYDPAGFDPTAETVIFAPALNYPLGVVATCTGTEPSACVADFLPEQQQVRVTVADSTAGPVTVTVAPARTYAAPIPGLSTHSALAAGPAQSQELELEQTLGTRLLRTDFKWSRIEPTDDDFQVEKYDALVDNAGAHGQQMLALLDYSQDWAEAEPGNTSTIDVNEFAEFTGVVAQHFADRILWYEIWNEENTERFWHPEPDPVRYGELLKASAIAIRAADPDAKIVFGGLASLTFFGSGSWPFLDDTLHAHPDLGNYIDAVAIHPYTLLQTLAPEADNAAGTYEDMLAAATEVLSRYGLERVPLVLTEMGWPACPCPPLEPPSLIPNVTYEEQAAYLVRAFLLGWAAGIEMFLWYDFYDGSGGASIFSEDWFGLVTHDAAPEDGELPELKPSYRAFQTLNGLLDGRIFGADLSPGTDCRLLRFDGEGSTLYAVWKTTDELTPCGATIPFEATQQVTVTAGDGEVLDLQYGPGEFQFDEAGALPTYLLLEPAH